ncbi:hypothetical protein [Leptospira saintgironsiae]|uniref:Uncharacterized protein n=1 Tax=Leptospira saintgironsiae TaxID=2023183 RepID=A0A2M9Y7I0_9LEPT|nr:hypothetical protein [Leptospira saintgironsiae]PJZ47469.1 hypothetical protein CH362_19025 [Leptospira saintgironsiae]
MSFFRSIFSKIQDIESATKIIRDCCNAILFFSLIQFVGLLLLKQYANLVDVFAYLLISIYVRKHKSRVLTVIFLILAIASFVVTILNRLGMESSGGGNILLAIALILVAILLLRAVFFWNNYYIMKMKTQKILLLSGLSILLFLITAFIGLVILGIFGDQMTDAELDSLSGTLLFSTFLISIIFIFSGIIPYSRGESLRESEVPVN